MKKIKKEYMKAEMQIKHFSAEDIVSVSFTFDPDNPTGIGDVLYW